MASMQPVTQSYLEEPSSCFRKPTVKPYNKDSVMDILMNKSPLMAYFAQLAGLDEMLDNPERQITCFAPCKEYCELYWNLFQGNTDHLRARNLVLSCVLKASLTETQLTQLDIVPTMNRYSSIDIRYIPEKGSILLNQNVYIVQSNLFGINGTVHITNGLIEPTEF